MLAASLLWAGLGAWLYYGLGFRAPEDKPLERAALDAEPEADEDEAEEEPVKRRRRWRGRSRRSREGRGSGESAPRGEATTGDDLGEGEMRNLDLAGGPIGEQQLRPAQIEAGFDGAMPGIRRCFLLAASDAEVRGRLVFAVRIAGDGGVRRVQLNGPAVLTTGDAGECLRRTARAIRFPTFDGPEMVARFPITLE